MDLFESFEQSSLAFGWNAHSRIGNADFDKWPPIRSTAEIQPDKSSLSKFDGVVSKVQNNLSEGPAVSVQNNVLLGFVDLQLNALGVSQWGKRNCNLIDDFLAVHALQMEFDLARFDFG